MARYFGWLLVFAAIIGVVAGSAFGAGRFYESRQATSVVASPSGAAARTPFAGPNGGPTGGAGRPVTGVVAKVEGQTLTVTTADNQSVTVNVPGGAPITRQAAITLTDITVGSRVAIVPQGTPSAGGETVAQSVAVVPDGSGGGRGAGGGGSGRGASGDVQSTPTPSTR
jgi:hypothetical protein